MALPSDHTMGHNTQENTLQGIPRGRNMLRRCNYVSEQVNRSIQPSSSQQQDGDPASGAHMGTGIRYTPYAIPCYHQRGNFKKHYQTHGNMEKAQKPPERMEEKKWNETSGAWFKIIIPFGIRYDEKWLLNLIQKQCGLPFMPVEFHYKKMQAQFFVDNARVAFALKNLSGKICDEDNEKISVFVNPSDAPQSVQKRLKLEKGEQIQLTMNKQHGVSQDSLDILRLRYDPAMATAVIVGQHLSFNQSNQNPCQLDDLSNAMQKACTITDLKLSNDEEKSAGQLTKGKGLEPEEMSTNRICLCTSTPDKSSSMSFVDFGSSILELFPKLLCLDGHVLFPPTNFGIEAHRKLPTCKGSFFGSDVQKSLVLQFLQQYFLIYDSGDWQGLLAAYHDEACFSLTIPFNPEDPDPSSLCVYFKDNRNMKTLKDPSLRVQLLKYTKRDIVYSLRVLPKTQHDFSSFMVDMWFQTEKMLCFSVNGVFKEGVSQGSVRAFSRTFIATPASDSSLCVVNDELFMRDATCRETQSAFSIQVQIPISNSGPSLSQEQQEMVQGFAIPSGMSPQCLQKYLHAHNWEHQQCCTGAPSAQA